MQVTASVEGTSGQMQVRGLVNTAALQSARPTIRSHEVAGVHLLASGVLSSHCGASACREFVVNIISHWMLEAANITCGDFKHNESEWEAANLTPLPSTKVMHLIHTHL